MKVKDLFYDYPHIRPIDIEYILRYKYNVDLISIVMNEDIEIKNEILEDIKRIQKNEPLQYIVGFQDFMGLEFKVRKGVLIPRFETEILVNIIGKEKLRDKTVLDLCCGSGAIGISISKLYNAQVTLCDISKDAIELTKENAKRNSVDITVIESNLFNQISGKFDFIVSNPPYIKTKDINGLEPNVKDYEPYIALDGGEDGLKFYRNIIKYAPKFLNDNGKLYLEIGHDQGEDVRDLLSIDFKDIEIIKDYNDFDRIAKATLRR